MSYASYLEEQISGLINVRNELRKEFNEYEYQGEGDEYGRECECGEPSVRMNGLCVKCDLGYKIDAVNDEISTLQSELDELEDEEDEDEDEEDYL